MKIFNFSAATKLAVVTRAKDDYELAVLTHPLIKEYAKKCKADFVILNKEKIKAGTFSYEIMQCYDLFDRYERILSIDSDVIVTKRCPNIFDIVPYDCIGSVFEDVYSRRKDRLNRIKSIQLVWGNIGWCSGYINSGFLVFSKTHREVLRPGVFKVWLGSGSDDVYLGYHIRRLGFKIYELPYKFNHMSVFSEMGHNWLKSYVIHYAGRGFSSTKDRLTQISEDIRIIDNVRSPFLLNFYHVLQKIRLIAIGLFNFYRNLFA